VDDLNDIASNAEKEKLHSFALLIFLISLTKGILISKGLFTPQLVIYLNSIVR